MTSQPSNPHAPFLDPIPPADDTAARAQLARLEARVELHRVAVGGCRVAFRRIGEGPPLVLLHGGHGSWMHWVRNVDALARGHTLWMPDMPGYGLSDMVEGPPTLENLAATVASAIAELPGAGSGLDLAGFSFGGLTAAHAAVHLPGLRRLALLGPSGHGTTRRERRRMLDWREVEGAERDARLRNNLASLMLRQEPEAIAPLALAIHRLSCEGTRFRSKGFALRPLLQEPLAALGRRGVPVLLVWGEHDVTGQPAEATPALRQALPTLRAEVVAGAGHWVQYEDAPATNALLADWFGGAAG